MKDPILVVDDDANVLEAVKRMFHGDPEITILTASHARQAMRMLEGDGIPVIISDHHMPDITGIELLEWAKTSSPDSMRILLTGCSDFKVAIHSINRGEVYRFITKPWNAEELRSTVRDALQRHKVIRCLKSGDENTILSLIRTIELKDPSTKGHSERVAGYALRIADALDLPADMKKDLRHGCLIHDCGKIGIPEAILNHPAGLDPDQRELVKQHARWGGEVVEMAGLHPRIVNIARYHHERYDGKGYPFGLAGLHIPIEARIVALADVYDALVSDRPYRKRLPHSQIVEYIQREKDAAFDPQLADLFLEALERSPEHRNGDPDS